MTQSFQPIQAAGLYLRLLVARQAELLAELKARRDEIDELLKPVPGADQPAMAQESSVAEKVTAMEMGELSRINEALKKIRTGTYGLCEGCSSSIPAARLKVVPWAERCRECEAPAANEPFEAIGRAS
jgi:DnaK suppressor protein